MMDLYLILRGEGYLTQTASIVLRFQQRQQLLKVGLPCHLSLISGLPVVAQARVIGAVTSYNLCETSYRCFVWFNQFVFAIVERPPTVIPEIVVFHPLVRFVWMAAFGPLPQHLPLAMSYFGKYLFSRTVPVIIGPPPDDGVEFENYLFSLFLLMRLQISFNGVKMFDDLLFLRLSQQGAVAVVKPADVETQKVEPFVYVNNVGFGFTQLQTALLNKLHQLWFDIGFQYLLRRGCYHKVVGITYQIQPFVRPFTPGRHDRLAVWPFGLEQALHTVQRNIRQQGRDYSALGRASFSVGVVTKFHYSGFKPASNCGSEHTQFCQKWLVSDVVKAAANICIEYPLARPFLAKGRMNSFDGIVATSSRSETVRVGLEFGLPFRLKSHFDDTLHHSVLHRRYPQRALSSVTFRDINPSNGSGLVPFEAQTFLEKLHPVLRCVAYYAVNTWSVLAPVFLCNSSDSQELGRSGSHQQFLKIFNLWPLLVFGSSVNPLLQTTYNCLCSKPVHLRPFPVRVIWDGRPHRGRLFWGRFSLHRLTSPQITTLQVFQYRQDQSDVSTLSGWVFMPCKGSPIRLITNRLSLLLTSHSLYIIPRSYDWDTAWWAGCIGLNQLTAEKMRTEEVGSCVPVGILIVVVISYLLQTYPLTILVTVCQPLLPFLLHETLSSYFARAQPFSSSLVHCYFEAGSFGTLSPKLQTVDCSFACPGRDT